MISSPIFNENVATVIAYFMLTLVEPVVVLATVEIFLIFTNVESLYAKTFTSLKELVIF